MSQDVFEQLPYLQKRHNKYGIRMRVPDELRGIIGKREVTRSLRTGDPAKAKPLYHKFLSEIEIEFDAARRALAPPEPALLTVEMAESLAQTHFQEQARQSESLAYRLSHDPHTAEDVRWQDTQELLQEVEEDLRDARVKGETYAAPTADRLLKEAGFPTIAVAPAIRGHKWLVTTAHVDRKAAGYTHFLNLTYRGQIEVWERMQAILRGEKYEQAHSLFPPAAMPQAGLAVAASQAVPLVLQGQRYTNAPIAVRELLKRFLAAHSKRPVRWRKDMEAAFQPLMELMGAETDANTLTKQNFRELLDLIRRMPSQIGNSKKKWQGMTLLQIIAANEKEGDGKANLLHPWTVNKYMSRIAQVMKWAVREPLIDHDHASGILIPAEEFGDDGVSRDPFTMAQLDTILSSPIFTQPNAKEPALYWAVLFSLFHGMRSEEILQLRADDFQESEDGIWFMDIHKRDGNHLKNKTAIRQVPVHPRMAEYGLRSLVQNAEGKADRRLFPDVERSAEGKFTPIFSRRFSRFLEGIGAKTETTAFHSFRHTFRDAARNCEVSDDRVCAIGGWKFGSGVHTSYGSGLAMNEKFKAIEKIAYPKVDFSRIRVVDWSKR